MTPNTPTPTTVPNQLDKTANTLRDKNMVQADRVHLNGDGWLDVTGNPNTVYTATTQLRRDPNIASEIRTRTTQQLTIRFARPDNHHAFTSV